MLFVVLAGTAAAALWRGYLVFGQHQQPATDSASMVALRAGVPMLVEAAFVLLAGKTVGELVVDLRTAPPSFGRRGQGHPGWKCRSASGPRNPGHRGVDPPTGRELTCRGGAGRGPRRPWWVWQVPRAGRARDG